MVRTSQTMENFTRDASLLQLAADTGGVALLRSAKLEVLLDQGLVAEVVRQPEVPDACRRAVLWIELVAPLNPNCRRLLPAGPEETLEGVEDEGARAVVLVTCSPLEVHGPHLPMGADALEGEGLAERMLRFRFAAAAFF